MVMNRRQEMFCREYVIDFNASRAARAAGYSRDTADVQGSRLLTNVECMIFLAELAQGMHKRVAMSAEQLRDRYARMIAVDRRNFEDEDGRQKRLADLDEETALLVDGVKLTDTGYEVKTVSQRALMRDYGETFGMFKQVIEQTSSVTVAVSDAEAARIGKLLDDEV